MYKKTINFLLILLIIANFYQIVFAFNQNHTNLKDLKEISLENLNQQIGKFIPPIFKNFLQDLEKIGTKLGERTLDFLNLKEILNQPQIAFSQKSTDVLSKFQYLGERIKIFFKQNLQNLIKKFYSWFYSFFLEKIWGVIKLWGIR